ncbi:MAG: hypothetical protein B7733_20985 [Myxococcales bacterium FL481]|nr:MAG: hypothetical protein B7733_20985 [Myxococcales bacterium FL481]
MTTPDPAASPGATTAKHLASPAAADSTVPSGDAGWLARFEDCELAPHEFGHREHVKVAWLYLCQYEPPVALGQLIVGLKRLAAAFGAAGKYHETITWAYVCWVHERMQRSPGARSWLAFERDNPDLFAWPGSLLSRGYTDEQLASPLARRCFVWPDRAGTADSRGPEESVAERPRGPALASQLASRRRAGP